MSNGPATEAPQSDAPPEEEERAAAAVSGPRKQLLARLLPPQGAVASDLEPLEVELTPPRRRTPDYLRPVAYHPAPSGPDDPPLPTQPSCWLQVWEMDRFEAERWCESAEASQSDARNTLICTIPGLVVRQEGAFEFRALGPPAPSRSRQLQHGSLQLRLPDLDGVAQVHEVWLPEYEPILEVACVLRERANCAAMEEVTLPSGFTRVHNVRGSAHRQLAERGGLTLAAVADHEIGAAKSDPKQRNDAELSRQAKAILDEQACFTVRDGRLALGPHLVQGGHELAGLAREVGSAAASLLGLGEPPPIATLLLFGHGIRDALRLNPEGYRARGSLQAKDAAEFVRGLDEVLAREVTLTLFACNAGRSARAGGNGGTEDPSYGQALAGEPVGADSLGWALARALRKSGRRATVWAHTTSGHTTRNPRLRVFSSWGEADLVSLLLGARWVESDALRHYVSRFAYRFGQQDRGIALQRLRSGALLRALATHSARYLPWGPLTGREPGPAEPGWSETAQAACRELVAALQGALTVQTVRPEAWRYEDATRRVVLGRAAEARGAEPLAPHFDLEEFTRAEHGSPLRLELSLVQALEILRERARCAVKVEALLEGGAMACLRVARRRQERVVEEALRLREEGVLTGAWDLEGRLYVSTGALEYDAELRWVLGARESQSPASVTRSIPWEQVRTAGRIRRTLCLAGQALLERGGTLAGVGEGGASLRVSGDVVALEAAAAGALRAGWIDAVRREPEGVVLVCDEGPAAN